MCSNIVGKAALEESSKSLEFILKMNLDRDDINHKTIEYKYCKGKIEDYHSDDSEEKIFEYMLYTPLMLTFTDFEKYEKNAKLLVKSGCDILNKSYIGDTLLHMAARNKCLKAIEYLISLNFNYFDADRKNDKGETPLSICINNNFNAGRGRLI